MAKVRKVRRKHCRTKRFWWVEAGRGEKKGQERDYLLADKKLRGGGDGGSSLEAVQKKKGKELFPLKGLNRSQTIGGITFLDVFVPHLVLYENNILFYNKGFVIKQNVLVIKDKYQQLTRHNESHSVESKLLYPPLFLPLTRIAAVLYILDANACNEASWVKPPAKCIIISGGSDCDCPLCVAA